MKKVAMDAGTHSKPIRYSSPTSKVGPPPEEWPQEDLQTASEAAEEMIAGTGA